MSETYRALPCSCYRLRRATRRVTGAYDAALEPLGLTATQFSVLAMIAADGPRPVGMLASALGMDVSTLSRTLRPLTRRGLVALAAADDRRTRRVTLTDAGAALLTEAAPRWRHAQARIERALGADLARLHALLDRLDGVIS